MKNLILVKITATLLLFTSCASFQNLPQILGTPQNVQAEITLLGSVVKNHTSADVNARIHQGATYLLSASNLDLDVLYQYLPVTTGSQNGDLLIAKAKEVLAYAKAKYGANNQTTLAYMRAVANGLLANF